MEGSRQHDKKHTVWAHLRKLPVSFQKRSLRCYLPTFAFAFSPKILGFYTKEKKRKHLEEAGVLHLPPAPPPEP